MPLNLNEIIDQEMADLDAQSSALPLLPVAQGADVTPPGPLVPMERQRFRQRAVRGVWDLFRKTGIPQVVGMTVEGIERIDTTFRGSILTSLGRMPLRDYPQFWDDAMKGKRRISGKEFNTMVVGKEWMDVLDRVGIPGWTKQVVNPQPWLGGQKPEKIPVVSLGSVGGLLSEVVVSPFAALSFTPQNFFTKTAVGRGLKTVFGPAERAVTYPLRKGLGLVFNNPKVPGFAFIQRLRDPVGALSKTPKGQKIASDMAEGDAEMMRDSLFWVEDTLGDIAKRWEKVVGPRTVQSSQVAQMVFRVIPNAPKGSPLRQLVDEINERVIVPNFDELSQMGYHNPLGLGKSVAWTRENMLGAFNPALLNRQNITRGLGEKTIRQRGAINLSFRNTSSSGKLPKYFDDVTDENWDIWHALSEWTITARKKAVFERRHRTSKVIKRRRPGITAAASVSPNRPLFARNAPSSQQIVEDVTIHPWVRTGFLGKYAPRGGWKEGGKRAPGNNPELNGLDINQFHYLMWKVNDFTGNARGRHLILEGLIGEKFWAGVEASIESSARKGRIRSMLFNKTKKLVDPLVGYNFPAFTKAQRITHTLLSNLMVSTLGLNLSTAIKQTSQLINSGSVKGIPAVMRGLYKMGDFWSDEGKMLRTIRKEAGLGNTLRKIVYDFEWQNTLEGTFHKTMFAPFNAMENLARGTSGTIAVGEFMAKEGIENYAALRRAIDAAGPNGKPIFWNRMLRMMREESNDTNLLYGLAGRSSLLSSPLARMGLALQSYSWKEAEFIARTFQRDGSAIIRLMAMHGWAIGMADRIAGVNAENWLGWGFLPPNSLGRGPQVEFIKHFIQYLTAVGSDEDKAADVHVNAMRGQLREVFRLFGNPDIPGEIGAAINGAAMAGLLPVPIIAIARTAKVANEFATGEREFSQGKTFKPVTRQEAMRSWFFQSHEDHVDQQLRTMSARARRIVQSTMDKRADKLLRAMQKEDGQAVDDIMAEFASPIQVGFGTSIPRAIFFRDQDDLSFWPTPTMLIGRLKRRMRQQTIARPVLEMVDGDWATELLWSKYIDQAHVFLQNGFVRGLTDKEQRQ